MKSYLEKCLRRNIDINVIEKNKSLPLIYYGLYHLYSVKMDGIQWIIVEPKEKIGLAAMRKNQKQLEKLTGLNCVLYFKNVNSYSKDVMLNEGIPFIVEGQQIYLPFIGVLLSNNTDRRLLPIKQISYLSQKILLIALYELWHEKTVTMVSEYIGVTKMSVSRCFDEMEYLEIPVLSMKGKSRTINVSGDRKEFWNKIQPILRNPVITTYEMIEDLKLEVKAGMSALCEYSMLEDNSYPTYAITKKELQTIQITQKKLAPKGEEMGCVIQKLGYYINYKNRNAVDPLTVFLSLSDSEKTDDRVRSSVEKMLKEHVW